MPTKNLNRKQRRTPAAQGEILDKLVGNMTVISQRLTGVINGLNIVNEDLNKLLRLNPVDTITAGDTVVIDYLGRLVNEDGTLGETFQGGMMKGLVIRTLGNGELVSDFEDQMMGKQVGSTLEVDITFPEDYHKHLANKKAKFFVAILEGLRESDAGSYVEGKINELNEETKLIAEAAEKVKAKSEEASEVQA